MRYVFGLAVVCALGMVPVGCSSEDGISCKTDADCSDDGNECTFADCAEGICIHLDVADATGCSVGVCLSRECTALTTASGTVTLIEVDTESAAVDAEVSWFGTSFSATTDERGRFFLELPKGELLLLTSKEGAWSNVEVESVSDTGLLNPNIEIIADAMVAKVAGDLMRDIPEEEGIVSVEFEPASAVVGGETVRLANEYQYHFAFTGDASGNWVISEELLTDGSRTLSFAGGELTHQLIVEPEGVEGANTCSHALPHAALPVLAKTVTSVQALCTPTEQAP